MRVDWRTRTYDERFAALAATLHPFNAVYETKDEYRGRVAAAMLRREELARRLTEPNLLRTDDGPSPAEWNRFDICEAWYLFAVDWHAGQGSATYAIVGRLDRIGFRPSPILSTRSLSPNGRLILTGLIRAARASRKVRVS